MKPRPTREMKRLLRDAGFQKKRQNGSHAIWKHQKTGHSITIVEKGGGRDMSPAMVVEALKVIDEVERTMAVEEGWVDINEAAKMLGVSHTTARALRDKGQLVGKKMQLGSKREKWFITTCSIRRYKGQGSTPAPYSKALLRVAALEKERNEWADKCAAQNLVLGELKAQVEIAKEHITGWESQVVSLKEREKWFITELEKIREHRDQLQECLDNLPDLATDLNPYIVETMEKLHKRLDSPEVRFLLGHGPSLKEVFESVLSAGILAVQKQLDEPGE